MASKACQQACSSGSAHHTSVTAAAPPQEGRALRVVLGNGDHKQLSCWGQQARHLHTGASEAHPWLHARASSSPKLRGQAGQAGSELCTKPSTA